MGRLMAWALPLHSIRLPRWLGGGDLDLNPGPFNIKEHTVITIMSNISFMWTTGLHVATAAEVYLDVPFSDRSVISTSQRLSHFGSSRCVNFQLRDIVHSGSANGRLRSRRSISSASCLAGFHDLALQSGHYNKFEHPSCWE